MSDRSGGVPELERQIRAADAGRRLDVYLAGQPEVGSRTLAKALIQAGQVRLGGKTGKPGWVVEIGSVVVFDPTPPAALQREPEPAVADPQVLFQDESVLVIDKPAGLVCHPAQSGRVDPRPSVSQWAAALVPDLPVLAGEDRPGIVHRLDKETSGVMVLAKTEDAFQFLKAEFQARRVKKEYRAISYGSARFDSDHIHRNIAPHPKKGDRMVVVAEGGREASTYYEVVERFAAFTHFSCRPTTGRTHQIRVHMTSVGHGLVGDRFYRARNHAAARLPDGAPDPGRHCLHAHTLEFIHPLTREPASFSAPIQADMQALLQWLQKHTPS